MALLWRCMSLFTISRLLGISRDNERLLFLSNACTMSRSGPMVEQGQEARQRRTKSTKIFTQGSTKPIDNSPEAVCLLRYPQYHRNGERYRELLRSHRMRREVEAANQNFFWRTCVVPLVSDRPTVLHMEHRLRTPNRNSYSPHILGVSPPEVKKRGNTDAHLIHSIQRRE